jgi:hypothetical protein
MAKVAEYETKINYITRELEKMSDVIVLKDQELNEARK